MLWAPKPPRAAGLADPNLEHRSRTAREHGKFRSWRGGAWWERVAASGAGARGSRAVASYVARGLSLIHI